MNNNRPDNFEFPNTQGNNDKLITKEQLDSLRANPPARRTGNSAPAVRAPEETSIDAFNSSPNEISFGDNNKDTFGKPAVRPSKASAPQKKGAGDANGFIDVAAKKKSKRKKIVRGIVITIAALLVVAIVGVLGYKHYLFSKMNVIETEGTIVDASGNTVRIADITQPTQHELINEDHIHNFLLIGIDSRVAGADRGNSDVNMVVSVDTEAGTIKMISIARDCYAHIPGYGDHKINAAMAYGGPELLEATIEQCLRLEIEGFAYVDFYNLAGVINAIGGVYIDVTSTEVYGDHGLNMCLDELGYGQYAVNQTGYIWVNGEQAVAYGRIRYVDNDYKRSERQVEVLRSMLDQYMSLSATGKLSALDDILSMISTNVTESVATEYAIDFLPSLNDVEIQYMQLPIVDPNDSSNSCFNVHSSGEWSIRPNWNAEIPFVQEFFYGEQTVFDPVDPIAEEPALENCPTPETLPVESLLR